MKFLDLIESTASVTNGSVTMDMLHQFGEFTSCVGGLEAESDMYINALTTAREPMELLQCSLDFIRCTYEPNPMGTWFLNGNPDFLDSALSESKGKFYYSSSLLSRVEGFAEHYRKSIAPSFERQGFDINKPPRVFVIITTPDEVLTQKLVETVTDVLVDNFVFDDEGNHSIIHTGFCRDDALAESVRVSALVLS